VVNADATINVRVGGHGPAVVLIHGFRQHRRHVVADGRRARERTTPSSCPTCAAWACPRTPRAATTSGRRPATIRAVLDKLGIDRADIVGHDIGTMVAYAYAARYPEKTSRLVVMDSPVPASRRGTKIVRLPALWHFNFGGPDAERLVAGRERIYLDRFWNEFAATRRDRRSDPPPLRRDLRQARRDAIPRSPVSSRSARRTRPTPQGDGDEAGDAGARHRRAKAFGANVAVVMRNASTNVQELVVPNAGHWLMEEAPGRRSPRCRTSSQRTESAAAPSLRHRHFRGAVRGTPRTKARI